MQEQQQIMTFLVGLAVRKPFFFFFLLSKPYLAIAARTLSRTARTLSASLSAKFFVFPHDIIIANTPIIADDAPKGPRTLVQWLQWREKRKRKKKKWIFCYYADARLLVLVFSNDIIVIEVKTSYLVHH